MMDTQYLLCWTRRRVWLVGPFGSPSARDTWTAIGSKSNAHDDPRWQVIEPNEGTLLMFTAHIYAPSDPIGYLRGTMWENE